MMLFVVITPLAFTNCENLTPGENAMLGAAGGALVGYALGNANNHYGGGYWPGYDPYYGYIPIRGYYGNPYWRDGRHYGSAHRGGGRYQVRGHRR
jgi:hypothetical protein